MNKLRVGDIMKLKDSDGKFLYLITKKTKDNFFGKEQYIIHFMCLNDGEDDHDTQTYINEHFVKVA